jgi:hypothetical protein
MALPGTGNDFVPLRRRAQAAAIDDAGKLRIGIAHRWHFCSIGRNRRPTGRRPATRLRFGKMG